MMKDYVPGSGSGGNGSEHPGQSQTNGGFSGGGAKAVTGYGASTCPKVSDTPKPKDGSKKSPKIFG